MPVSILSIIQVSIDNMFGMALQLPAGRGLHPQVLLHQGDIGCGPGIVVIETKPLPSHGWMKSKCLGLTATLHQVIYKDPPLRQFAFVSVQFGPLWHPRSPFVPIAHPGSLYEQI